MPVEEVSEDVPRAIVIWVEETHHPSVGMKSFYNLIDLVRFLPAKVCDSAHGSVFIVDCFLRRWVVHYSQVGPEKVFNLNHLRSVV